MADKRAVEKRARAIRWLHWLNFPLLGLMVWSGLLIYWANDVYVPLPKFLTQALGLEHRLAEGLGWHFTIAWLFVINGLIYVAYLAISGEWREILPEKKSFREALQVTAHDLHLGAELPPQKGKLNAAQRIAYTSVLFLAAGAVLSGIAIARPVQLSCLTTVLGGYEAARLEHFIFMGTIVAFFFVHVAQVARAGLATFRAMVPSLGAAAFFIGIVLITIVGIRTGTQVDNLATSLRTTLETNGELSRSIFSEGHVAIPGSIPPAGKQPRVNGKIGLEGEVDEASYMVVVESGEKHLVLSMNDIKAMPRTQTATDFKCIEGWSELMQYAGVRFTDFMDKLSVGRRSDGSFYRYVGLETPDDEYYVSIDIESMRSPQTILAYEMNQAPLKSENGFPLRLMIPNKYGIKNLKRVGKIFFSDVRPADYWAEEGYDWYAGL